MVTFKHGREQVTVDNLKYGCKLEDLQVKVLKLFIMLARVVELLGMKYQQLLLIGF